MALFFDTHRLVLMEAAIVERLRRGDEVELHPALEHGLLVYDSRGAALLASMYEEYLAIAREAGMPLLLCTPTWRANRERVEQSRVASDINGDAVRFMSSLRSKQGAFARRVRIGGLIGCKNDCYRSEEGLSSDQAERFHAWQIDALARAGVDYLMAATLPTVEEAIGIARAMAVTRVPYVISFVIDRTGHVLDGASLLDATKRVDDAVARPPTGFMVNCAHPSFLCPQRQPPGLFERLIGFQANASSLDHDRLDGAQALESDTISAWGDGMLTLHREYGVRILGGCCGTGPAHLRYIVDRR